MKMLLSVVMIFVCVGCASTPPAPNIQTNWVLDAGFDRTWSAVVAVFAENNYPVKAIEKESGLISAEALRLPNPNTRAFKEYAILPNVFLGTWSQAQVTINVFAVPEDGEHTRIQINSSINAYENNVTNTWYPATSTGKIEADLSAKIRTKLL